MAEGGRKEQFTYFWRNPTPFSQWHMSTFHVDGQKYNCAEQYMMHQKAVLFNDHETADQILREKKPRAQKGLGRKVKNFDEQTWEAQAQDIVKKGNIAKFSQKEDLREALFNTAGTVLVEASPYDSIWGIGCEADDYRAGSRNLWPGRNLLGFILTDVREQLMREAKKPT